MDEPPPADAGRDGVCRYPPGFDQIVLREAVKRDEHEILVGDVAYFCSQHLDEILHRVLAVAAAPHRRGGPVQPAGDMPLGVIDEQLIFDLFGQEPVNTCNRKTLRHTVKVSTVSNRDRNAPARIRP